MARNIRNSLLFVLAVVLLNGCFRYASSIYPDEVLESAKGYVYGRFSNPGFSMGLTNMGVVVTSVDKKQKVALRFEPSPDPYAVAVDPGDYQATHIVYTQSAANDIKAEKRFPEELSSRVIHVEAGKAYYIGDFEGASKSTFLVLIIAYDWQLDKITNDFAGTTAKLDALFPQMKHIPKVDVFGDALVTAFSRTDTLNEAPKKEVSSDPAPLDGAGSL